MNSRAPEPVGTSTTRGASRHRAPRHARRRGMLGRIAGLGALAGVLFVGTSVGLAYADIQGNIQREDIAGLLDRDSAAVPVDPSPGEPLNFLLLGNDIRDGDSDIDGAGEAGEVTGMRADTTMLVHVSADRDRLEVVSIPRDTLVTIPPCKLPDGSWTERVDHQFNHAFALGGDTGSVGSAAACTIRTVEQMTGLHIDDFVVVDFAGFINVIDALDGIAVYVPEDVDDPLYTGLSLEAGCHVMDGPEALTYARVRHGVGDGGDISRISRQQDVVQAVVDEALSRNLLTDMPALYSFLDAATRTLTTGPELGQLTTLAGLATSLRTLDGADINFITMPWEPAGPRVEPAPEARELWLRLQADRPASATASPTQSPSGTSAPEEDENASTASPSDTNTDRASATTSPTQSPSATEDETENAAPVCTK